MTDLPYELGELRGRLETLETLVAEQRADIKCLLRLANEVRGGWRTVLLVAGFAGAVGAALTKLAGIVSIFR